MRHTSKPQVSTDLFLAHCARVARLTGGWISVKDALAKSLIPTAESAFDAALAGEPVDDQDLMTVAKARDLFETRLLSSHRTSFDDDLAEALQHDRVTAGRARLVAAVVGFYHRVQASAAQAVAGPPSFYIGAVGERLVVRGRVTHISQMPSAWGLTLIVNMVTPQGARLTWFTSRNTLNVDQEATLRVTIKDHREFRGQPQTVVTRCVIVQEAEVAVA